MKIFCDKCRYFKTFVGIFGSYREFCKATQNTSHLSYYGKQPSEINEKNDCEWFEMGNPERIDLLYLL